MVETVSFLQSLKRDGKGDVIEFDIDPRLVEQFAADAGKAVRPLMDSGDPFVLVTAPEARGRGAARALVASLMAWGRGQGATQAYLHVTRQNEAARRLYRSLGFSDAYALTQRVLAMG